MTGTQTSKAAQPPPRKRPVKKPVALSPKPAVWSMAECDEQQWREMGCPTMGTALAKIKALEVRIENLQAELLATPVPAPNSKMLARKAKRSRGGR
jgi:hypothetical protein